MLLKYKQGCLKVLYKHCLLLLLACHVINVAAVYAKDNVADTVKIKQMLKAVSDSMQINPPACYDIAEKAMHLSEQAGYKIGVARSLLAMGVCKMNLGEIPNALDNYNKAFSYAAENGMENQQNRALVNKGTLYAMIGAYDSAIACFIAVGEKLQKKNDVLGMAGIYVSIGNCESEAHNFADADKYYAKAEVILQKLNNPEQTANLYNNIAANDLNQEKYPDAIKYSKKCMNIFISLNDSERLINPFHNLGLAYSKTNNVDSGLFYLSLSLKLAEKTNNLPAQSNALHNIASVYSDKKKYDEAIVYYTRSLAIDTKIKNWLGIFNGNSALAGIYKEKKELALAMDYMTKSIPAHDSLINENKIRTVEELTTKYETNEIEGKNKSLEKENSIQKLKIQRKNILLYGGSISLLLFGFGFLLIRNNKLKANQKLMKVEQKQLLAQMNPHFIFNCLNSIQQYIVQNDAANANRYLADFALLMRQTLENSKDSTIPLSREIEYLQNYMSLESMRFENKFSYTITYSPDLSLNAIEIPSMIIQPFVENAIHHGLRNLEGKIGRLEIKFYKKNNSLYCEVDDNGIGMEKSQKLKENSFIKYQSHGIDLTRQRLALVSKLSNTDYHITMTNKNGGSQHSEGTTVVIKFPLSS